MSSQVPLTISTDQVTQTSLGTGVAETQLNNSTSYVVPSWAKQLVEFTPVQYATGAVTAAQSFTPKFKIKSISIGGLEPKEIVIAPISACLGATSSNTTPVLRSFRLNRNMPGSNINIDFYAQNLVANTVANAGMATVKLSSVPTGQKEQFYLATTDETDSGTTAATIDSGQNIILNGASGINFWYGQLMPVTVVASESYAGYMEFTSSDFTSVQRVRWSPYQITAGLSTLITTIVPDQMYYEGWVPVRNTATIVPKFIQNETVNAAYDWIPGLGFVR